MRINHCILSAILLFLTSSLVAQTVNFDETWKEFLENNKISNMSELIKPDKTYDLADYTKYLLMNTNSDFCQSDISSAEAFMEEINTIDPLLQKSITGFVQRKKDIESKMKAYYSMDEIWADFLKTREVSHDELEAIKAAKTSCEKKTLAKYSYMTAHAYMCEGEIDKAKNIFENRTLKLAEKTSLRVRDVKGLEEEVRKMKSLFSNLDGLNSAWQEYLKTGVSPGYDKELPLFNCYPIPNMKALVLRGSADICNAGDSTLEEIKKLQTQSGADLGSDLDKKIKELETSIQQREQNLADLNAAWAAFIPENKVPNISYSYDYCSKEPLIKAYIMDGFSFVCELAEESLEKIDALQKPEITELEQTTLFKIKELNDINEQYKANDAEIEATWNKFISQGDTLYQTYQSTDTYCDNIHQVKDWIIGGYCGTCEEKNDYLEKIDAFQSTIEFSFSDDVECRIRNLRLKLWDCRYQMLQNLAQIEAGTDDYSERLQELLSEYNMGQRPEVCNAEENR